MIWAFRCEVIEVDGNMYLKSGERSYHPRDSVLEPKQAVEELQKDLNGYVWCSLYGMNSSEIRALWVDRDKTKDQKPS
jgi:hypothetical protein